MCVMAASSQVSVLSGGLRVATVEMPWMESLCAGMWCEMGSRHEAARINGVCHFLEHMVFKGTARRSATRIVREIEQLGGYINAFTAEDHTCYHVKALADRLPGVVDVLCDFYFRPKLELRDMELEREVIAEEIRGYHDNATTRVEDMLDAALWPGEALGRPVTGTLETLGRITREDLVEQHKRGYVPRRTIVAVAGRVEHEKVVESFLKHMPEARGERAVAIRCSSVRRAPLRLVEGADVEQCHVELGFRTGGRRHKDRYALRLLSILLAENMSSRLFQRLRERLGLCYHVQSEVHLLEDCGSLVIHLALDAANVGRALDIVGREMERFIRRECSRGEVRGACGYAVGQLVMGSEKVSGRMFQAGESLLAHGRVEAVAEVVSAYQAVTGQDVQRVAMEVLQPGRMAAAAVCPDEEMANVGRALDAFCFGV